MNENQQDKALEVVDFVIEELQQLETMGRGKVARSCVERHQTYTSGAYSSEEVAIKLSKNLTVILSVVRYE